MVDAIVAPHADDRLLEQLQSDLNRSGSGPTETEVCVTMQSFLREAIRQVRPSPEKHGAGNDRRPTAWCKISVGTRIELEHVLRGWTDEAVPAKHNRNVEDVLVRNVTTDIRGGAVGRVPDGNPSSSSRWATHRDGASRRWCHYESDGHGETLMC